MKAPTKPWWALDISPANADRDWDVYEWDANEQRGHFYQYDADFDPDSDEDPPMSEQGSLFQPLTVTVDKSKYFAELVAYLATQSR